MQSWLANKWENLRASLWFLPSVVVAFCIALAVGTLHGDHLLAARDSEAIPFLFSGTADAARTMLSTIASSLLTVLSIAFSLTMVALQQASSQFSPRVLRSVTSSRVNQTVVGVYSGTFIYALLILRTIRGEHSPAPFVPALSVTTAVLLALVCIAMLVYFIHHVSLSLQVSDVIKRLHDELVERFEQRFPEPSDDDDASFSQQIASESEQAEHSQVRAREGGFVRRIDLGLAHVRAEHTTVWLTASVGEFVPRGGLLARVAPAADGALSDKIRSAYVFDSERSHAQDPLFDIRQLVDIGLRALSPGVNDPTTAEYVLRQLGDALCLLVSRQIPARTHVERPGHVRLVVPGPDWDTFVEGAFSQLRRACRADFDVTRCLLEVLMGLSEQTLSLHRVPAIRLQVDQVRLALSEQNFSLADRERLSVLCELVLDHASPSALAARAALRTKFEPR
jgi:uncharacterized membrane protein